MSLSAVGIVGKAEVYFSNAKGTVVDRKTLDNAYEAGHLPYTFSLTDYGGFVVRRVTGLQRHDRCQGFLKVTTRRGRWAIVTEEQRLFVRERRSGPVGPGMSVSGRLSPIEAKQLIEGQRIAVLGNWYCNGYRTASVQVSDWVTAHIDKELMELVGLWLAEGSLNQGHLRFSFSTKEVCLVEKVKRAALASCEYEKPGPQGGGVDVTLLDRGLSALFHALGLCGRGKESRTLRIPGWAFGRQGDELAGLLRGYFSGDGSISGHVVESTSASRGLSHDVAFALLRFGIMSSLRPHGKHLRVTISKAADVRRFEEQIGFLQPEKRAALSSYVESAGSIAYRGREKGRKRRSVFWDEVASIKAVESNDGCCYELGVDGTSRFITGGLIVAASDSSRAATTSEGDGVGIPSNLDESQLLKVSSQNDKSPSFYDGEQDKATLTDCSADDGKAAIE